MSAKVCARERRQIERRICSHTLPQLVYLSDKIMECRLICVWFRVIRLFLLRWASLRIQKNVPRIPEANVDLQRKYRCSHRHCVFASLYRIKNVAMTDIPPGGTKLRNALKRINKHVPNFANLLAQPFRRSTAWMRSLLASNLLLEPLILEDIFIVALPFSHAGELLAW